MLIDSIQNGIVIDHITAGKAMELYQILGLPDACGINDIQANAVHMDMLLQGIPGRSGNIRHNGTLLAQKHIHQRRFSRIRLT